MRHIAIAIIGPCLVVALMLAPILATRSDDKSEDALAVEQALLDAQPGIVLLGASTMNLSVDVDLFEEALGDSALPTAKLVKAGTTPAVWYVLAKERLFGAGVRPKLLVVGSTPKWLLHTGVSSQGARAVMANHMLEYHPCVARKAYGQQGRSVLAERLERGRVSARAGFLEGVRAVAVGLLHGDGQGRIVDQGRRIAEPALARVFSSEGAVDPSLHARVVPVVEAVERAESPSAEVATTVAGSFVPDLVELAQEHDARVVFVWLPYPTPSAADQQIDPALLAELVRGLNDAGAGWLDLHELDFPDSLFVDNAHMNAKGRARFSRELARALLEMGALGDGPLPQAEEPFFVGSRLHLEGEPAALAMPALQPHRTKEGVLVGTMPAYMAWSNLGTAQAGLGATSPLVVLEDGEPLQRGPCASAEPAPGSYCHVSGALLVTPRESAYLVAPEGHYALALERALPVQQGAASVWWVYPGTSLVAEIDGESGAGPLEVELTLETMGSGGAPTVVVAGQPMALEPRQEVLAGRATLAAPPEPWSIRVEVPAEGAMVALRHLALSRGTQRIDLAGSERQVAVPTVDLFVPVRQGRMELHSSFEPWTLEAPKPHPNGILGRVQAPWLEGLSNERLVERTQCPRCSPLRLLEGEVEYGPPLAHCGQLRNRASGGEPSAAFCQQGEEIQLASIDGGPPWEGGRRYRVGLPADRRASVGTWLAPGDHATIPVARWQGLAMRHGVGRVVLEGVSVPVEEANDEPIAVTLLLGDQPSHQLLLDPADLDAGPVELVLDPPLLGRMDGLAVRLESPSTAPFVMLSRAVLEE